MRKILILSMALLFSTCSFAQSLKKTNENGSFSLPEGFDPWNVQRQFDQKQLLESLKKEAPPAQPSARQRIAMAKAAGKGIRQANEDKVDTVTYFAATQSFRKNYIFTYEGGDIKTYNIGIAINGTKVTIKNLFDLYNPEDYTPSVEYPVDGTYDPDAKTITIPTSSQFSKATVIGEIGGYLVATLQCGTINKEGKLSPDDKLVFNVVGDFDAITTKQAIAVGEYTKDGSQSYGLYKSYRSFYAALPKANAKLIAFNNNFEYGETFPNTPVSHTMTLINVGTSATDYAVDLESDGNSFTSNPVGGTVAGQDTASVTFTLNAKDLGQYEGIATINYESASGDAEPLIVQLNGGVKEFPDYSGIIKRGDLKITTGIEYPFEMQTLKDGTKIASSTTHGLGDAKSYLIVSFTVPENNIGKFSWKGKSFNGGRQYSNAGGYFIDDATTPVSTYNGVQDDISGSWEFGPGKHTVKYQYDSYYYTGDDYNRLYVYDLDLENTPAEADKAELETPKFDFGSFIVQNDTQEGKGELVFLNRGYNPLKVINVSSDNEAFSIVKPGGFAKLMERLNVPISFRSDKADKFNGNMTVETTAGTFVVPVEAIVRDFPDYKQIVTEGADLMTFSTDPANPFIVENGVAYNASSKKPDYKANTAWFQVNFNIPDGKAGYISWKGHSYGTTNEANPYNSDYSLIEVSHPMTTGDKQAWGDSDAGSQAVFGEDDFWKSYLTCVPGEHYVKFAYYQCGDTVSSEKDRLEISDLKLHVIDFPEHGAELLNKSVKFDSTYVGYQRYTTAKVTLHNTGSKELKVTEVTGSDSFYGIVPKETAQFDKDIEVELWFYPTREGEFVGTDTIKTNAGNFIVDCSGVAKSSKGIIFIGDIEDEGYGWSYYDADGDGECWDLGYNLFGGNYPEWCHSGNNCFGSASFSWFNGDIVPNNWLFSPQINIPEDGGTLRWYVASHNKKKPSEHYSVYIEEADKFKDASQLSSLTPKFSETLDTIAAYQWQSRTLDLKDYAGKTICIAFRHHDCKGQYVLKIDDIFVYNNGVITGINNPANGFDENASVVRQEVYDISGRISNSLKPGINLIRKFYSDGTVKTTKIYRKQ